MPINESPLVPAPVVEGQINLSEPERLGSIAAGLVVLLAGLARRRAFAPLYLALGGYLLHRGATGTCQIYEKIGLDTSEPETAHPIPSGAGLRIEDSITIPRPPLELYSFWRNLENLPVFMPHLKSVIESDNGISHWIVSGPGGIKVEWDAEILQDEPGRLITWQSLPGAVVASVGTVRFEPTEDGAGTRLTVQMKYDPPAGKLGALAATVFGANPEAQLKADLARFEQLLSPAAGES